MGSSLDDLDRLYTTEEVAEFLKTSKRTVQRYIAAGLLKASMIGGGYRISKKELQRFIESRAGVRTRQRRGKNVV